MAVYLISIFDYRLIKSNTIFKATERQPMNQNISLNAEISILERKIELLVTQHFAMKDEIKRLYEENKKLKVEIGEKEEEINHFQKTIKINKIANSAVASADNTTELKRTINEYIRKIDKCIAQLSQ